MDANRIKQIVSSSADIEVQYNGVSVWIDKLHEDERNSNSPSKRSFGRTIKC